jgi:concentrative nucleoside transporter, CNT family|tara:strand:- start:1955 stop:3205 length:1251 start_codon:yes stop_codon:yes gene_type:complete
MEYIQPIAGFLILLLLGIVFSNNVKGIKIKYVFNAIVIQLLLAIALLKWTVITDFFALLSRGVIALTSATDSGVAFVFGYLANGAPGAPFEVTNPGGTFIFAFGGLILVVVVSAISALLWHWRIIPLVVNGLSVLFKRPLNVGGPVGLSATANIFLGQVEAPLLIKPYLQSMTKHELLILMTVGMSTIAGSLMATLNLMLMHLYGTALIGHFLTASIISVPAAIMYANMMIPSDTKTEFPITHDSKMYRSTMDALTEGTRSGLEIFLNIIALLIVVLTIVALINMSLGLLPDFNGGALSLERMAGWLFAPLAWCMGIPWSESQVAGELLGIKTITNEFVAYIQLAQIDESVLSDRSQLIMLYALCGFANLSSIGILISGMGAMAPERKADLIEVSGKALWAAILASCMTGFIVGII